MAEVEATTSLEWMMSPVAAVDENRTIAVFEVAHSWAHVYIVSIFLGFLIICIICGNALVVLAVLTERHLRVVSNYLILSLAMADLLVAVVVMPLSLVHEVSKVWWLGLSLCDLWICADVLLCTVSTLHLCAIAIERCLAVSSLAYLRHRSATFVLIMVSICWILATMVSLPARFHARRQLEIPNVVYEGICEINMGEGYTIYSNLLAFDLPMVFIVLMYARIYFTARRHIRKKHFVKYQTNSTTIKGNSYQSATSAENLESHRYCCYCCGYVMETRFHKGRTMFNVDSTQCSGFQCSSSSDKRMVATDPPETVVAAAVTAMRIAATMISTTKEPEWGTYESESSDSEGTFNLISFNSLKNPNYDNESQFYASRQMNCQPLTYDTLRSLRKQKELGSNREVIASPSGKELVRELSSYTNCSSILYADENSKPNSLSSSVYSSMIHTSDSREVENGNTTEEPQLRNFVPLCIYYKKQRQQRWLAQGRIFNKKASEVMKNLSVNESDSGIKPEEERYLRERLEQRRERKTVRTLAIITGCFVLCWLPFNIHALLSPFFGRIHPIGVSVLLWLGYLNSLLNPIIYTIFSKDFRSAFRRIICQGPRLKCFH
nr:serotonergic G protein coupled receptor [Echinococcus canadensis]